MEKNNILLSVLIMYTLVYCQNRAKNEVYFESKKIYKQAIEIHDEVMPLMGKIMELQSTLKARKETISDDKSIEKINIELQKLENAHNSMMLWMRNITPIPEISENESDFSTHPSAEEMLEIQQKSLDNITKVKEAILSSIENANALILELETKN